MSVISKAYETLQSHFGFSRFREGQAEVIEAIFEGRDAIVVMPTGGGKSLCYQLPGALLDGITLVVSPLIALMKDQVDALSAHGISTTFINSSLAYRDLVARMSGLAEHRYKVVYVAPERFRNEYFMKAIEAVKVRLLAVDEAHCISHWGHDFRPDYLKLRDAAERLGRPQIVALTATATPQVRNDIIKQLGLNEPRVFVAGFDRPNLALRVVNVTGEDDKIDRVTRVLQSAIGSGIIYAATRKGVERLAGTLRMKGFRVEPYHAGMFDAERSRAQDLFMSGKLQAIIATNAFGMGIDKPDIRFVIHYHVPGSIEAYYQEVGRAGRDGLPSDCILLFSYADVRTQEFFIEGNNPPLDLIADVYTLLSSFGREEVKLSAREISTSLAINNEMAVNSALILLEKAGHLQRGRAADATVTIMLKSPLEEALGAVKQSPGEDRLLRELAFTEDVNTHEATEVDVNELSESLGISATIVRRMLGSLAARELIAYRTGFSGRGVLMIGGRAERLRIDGRELDRRAAAEQWKLRKMIDYCYHTRCLRRFILGYFGDRKRIGECSTCSVCAPGVDLYRSSSRSGRARKRAASGMLKVRVSPQQPVGESEANPHTSFDARERRKRIGENIRHREAESVDFPRPLTEAEVIIVKKVLSCVARVDGRFGKGTISAVLRGEQSRQITENQLNRLSTYGLLSDMPASRIAQFIMALVRAGCMEVSAGNYPTLKLTEVGRHVMTGRSEIKLDLPA